MIRSEKAEACAPATGDGRVRDHRSQGSGRKTRGVGSTPCDRMDSLMSETLARKEQSMMKNESAKTASKDVTKTQRKTS